MNKTYDSVCLELNELTQTKKLYDSLAGFGVAKKNVHHARFYAIDSNYSMGEYTHYSCNGKEFHEVDCTHNYSKNCQWKAKYGHIYVEFTKKDLNTFVLLCKSLEDKDGYITDSQKVRDFIHSHINVQKSIYNMNLKPSWA